MPSNVVTAIDRQIATLEGQLGALRRARKVLGASFVSGLAPKTNKKRRKLTDAEKAFISRRMKETWKKRKAASKTN